MVREQLSSMQELLLNTIEKSIKDSMESLEAKVSDMAEMLEALSPEPILSSEIQ